MEPVPTKRKEEEKRGKIKKKKDKPSTVSCTYTEGER